MDKKDVVEQLLAAADIRINGDRPWDIQVRDDRLYARVLRHGTLGLGEAYMDGWWEAEALDEFVFRAVRADLKERIRFSPALFLHVAEAVFFNLGKKTRAFHIGEAHYDIGNDLYRHMLDRRMTYTCGYWKDADNLDDAQEAKLDLVCKKIGLTAEDRVLDIGCGWGSFAAFAAEKYGARVVGVTVSKEQAALGRTRCAGLPVEIRLQDYRDVDEKFDHIVSLGMFEHVGYKNYRTYMDVARRCLKEDGLFLLHTIGGNISVRSTDPWIQKYIFPNSMLPSLAQIARAAERRFVVEDLHNFGADYDKTLMAWYNNFNAAWPDLSGAYTRRFSRMWRFYLLSCAGMFRARSIQLWQIVLSKRGVLGGYESIRT